MLYYRRTRKCFFYTKNLRGVLMAKKRNENLNIEDLVVQDKTAKKKQEKELKKQEKENILKEKKKIENKIDALAKDKKAAKDKESKKDLKKEINKLKKERKEIGKKDTYLRDIKKEMNMVRWPSASEVVKYSIASLVFVAFFALFFYGIDALFALVKDLIN